MPRKLHEPASQAEAPPWEILQEKILAVLNDYADENPVVPDALLLTGAGLAYVTFATTRYGADAFQNVYENLRSIVQLFQLIIDDERKHLPTSVQQPPTRAAAESLTKEDVAKVAEQVLSQTLLNTQPVNALGIKTQKNRVNVRLADVVHGKDATYVRYQVTNLSTVPYRVIAPNVSVLAAEGASMPPINQQLGAGYLERLGKVSSTPIELLHSEIDQQDVAPGKTSTGVLAIHSTDGSPQIYQFVFGSDNASPIVTAAVL